MSLYSDVRSVIGTMEVGEMQTIPIPDKLKAFRKFLSEIAGNEHKKFTTKVVGNSLHIMRVNYFSIPSMINP
jgi:hypothetical protein